MDTPGEPGASADDVQLSAPASASPRLRRILDKYASELLASSFENGQQVSIMDLSFNEPADFTCRGRHVLNEATQVAKKSMQASLDAARDLQSRKDFMHNSPHMAKMVSKSTPILPPAPPGLSVLSSTASGKKPRITEPTSAMRKEDDAKLQASRACLEVMGMAQRKAALQGFDIVPLAEAVVSVQDALILAGAVGTMLNACSSIRKLKIWLVSRFGGDLGFVCPEAVVSWFLRDHKIGGTETVAGHVPQNLRSGLVWAHKHMGFASVQCMESDAVKGADSRAARRPVPAVSASVRMWYFLEQLACDVRVTPLVRYYAAAFCVCIIAALRGIDAQRSEVVQKFAKFWHCSAYDSKTGGGRIPMPWSLCLTSISDSPWWEALDKYWTDDFLFPALSRNGIFDAGVTSVDAPASPSNILRYLRDLLAHVRFADVSICKVFRRHSFRHLLAHCARALGLSREKSEQLGRWGWLKVMSVRYAAEVEFASTNKTIEYIITQVRAALEKVPIAEWPPVGGWELLVHMDNTAGLDEVRRQLAVSLVSKDDDELADDSDSEDESARARPRRAAPRSGGPPTGWEPPAGWALVEVSPSNGGKSYKVWRHDSHQAKPQSKPALYRYLAALPTK